MHFSPSLEEIRRTMPMNVPAQVIVGVVSAVNSENLTVDVYDPASATILYGVSLLCKTISKDNRSIEIPELLSPVVVVTATTGGKAFAIGGFFSPSQETVFGDGEIETLYSKERSLTGGGAFLRQTRNGSSLIGGKTGNQSVFLSDMTNRSLSTGKFVKSAASDLREGFSLADLTAGISKLQVRMKEVFLEEIQQPCNTYAPADITDQVVQEVLLDASNILGKINGGDGLGSLIKRVSSLQAVFSDPSTVASQTKLTEIESLINSFLLPSVGVKIELQAGSVSNADANLVTSRVSSSHGNYIVGRLLLKDNIGSVLAELSLDRLGKIDVTSPAIRVNGRRKELVASVSLGANTAWSGGPPYVQTVSVPGVQSADRAIVQPIYSSTQSVAVNEKTAWSMIDCWTTGTNEVSFRCITDRPATQINAEIILI